MKRMVVFCCMLGLLVFAGWVSAFPITVTDVLARQVTINAPPQRIVSLAPSHTEQLFAIGAGERVVGVTLYDNYPPPVQHIARVGGYVAKSISIEKIVSLRPDLVLSRGEIQRAVITALQQIGIAVVALEPKDFDEVYDAMILLGRLTDRQQQAEQVVTAMRRQVARVRHLVTGIPKVQRARVFYKAYDEPLIAAGPSTFIGHLIEMAGGINIFADVNESYPQVSAEEVLRRDPTVILGPAGNGVKVAVISPLQRPGWRHLSAVKNRRLYLLDDDLVSRPGPRLAAALEVVARALYPDRFP